MDTSNDTTNLKTCPTCGQAKPTAPEYFYLRNRLNAAAGFDYICKQCRKLKNAAYYLSNVDAICKRSIGYAVEHRSEKKEYDHIYGRVNRDKKNTDVRKYQASHPEVRRATKQRRRARKMSLPNTLTKEDIEFMSDYFKGICAVCGKQADSIFGKKHLDHWIPLSSGGGTTPDNMIPLCAYCNRSKNGILPVEWLTLKFGKRKAKTILARIEAYFATLKQRTGMG